MGGRLAEYLAPLLGAALVVAVGMALLLFQFDAPAGAPNHPHQPVQAASPRSPSPAQVVSPADSPPPTPAPSATPPPAPAPPPPPPSAAPGPAPASGTSSMRLVVPAAQINAPVETVGLDRQGDIGVPSQAMDAAWYDGSVTPGAPGNAIIDGHLDWWTGPGVFGHLSQVRAGDQIGFVRADGSQVNFSVTGEQVFGAGASVPAGMLSTSGPATVSLITCTGSWDAGRSQYLQRLIVNGSLS